MSGLSLGGDIGIDSPPVVTHDQFKRKRIGQDNLHFGACGVVEGIANRFVTDAFRGC
jgi:hypothetical protein